jgi:hypothetical protein
MESVWNIIFKVISLIKHIFKMDQLDGMKRINYRNIVHGHLIEFRKLLKYLYDSNLVIGGKCALGLHGLNVNQIGDIDIIIYKPTEKQLQVLNHNNQHNLLSNRQSNPMDDEYTNKHSKVYKFRSKDRTMDIIIVDEPLDSSVCLSIEFAGLFDANSGDNTCPRFHVQSIHVVCDAKASYCLGNVDSSGEHDLKYYGRKKDFVDLQYLKNNNFNV